MAGTALTDLNAITLTTTAKAAGQAAGVDLPVLMTLAKDHATEMTRLLNIIHGLHPSGGGDAANYSALTAIIAELA